MNSSRFFCSPSSYRCDRLLLCSERLYCMLFCEAAEHRSEVAGLGVEDGCRARLKLKGDGQGVPREVVLIVNR